MKNKWSFTVLLILFILLVTSAFYLIRLLNFSGFAATDSKPLFSIRMVDFQSPVVLGDVMGFSYLIRDISDIGDIAKVSFWLEKDGKVMALGSDTIYLGNLEEKIRTGSIFLPSELESGIYNFKIKLDYGGYSAESYRTIEISVLNGVANINPGSVSNSINPTVYIIIALVLLAFLDVIIFYLLKRKKKLKIFDRIKNLFRKKQVSKAKLSE